MIPVSFVGVKETGKTDTDTFWGINTDLWYIEQF